MPPGGLVAAMAVAISLDTLTVDAIPADFECAWRTSAYKYAGHLQPWLTSSQKDTLAASLTTDACNINLTTWPPRLGTSGTTQRNARSTRSAAVPRIHAVDVTAAGSTFIVDPNGVGSAHACNDTGPGTVVEPLCSVSGGVAKCRAAAAAATAADRGDRGPAAFGCVVELRQGMHRLAATISLTAADSGLTIKAFDGDEAPVVTGAVLLPNLQWTKHAMARPTAGTTDDSAEAAQDRGATNDDSADDSAEAAQHRGANCTTLPSTDVSGGNDLPHSGAQAATVVDCVAMCANECSCNVAVYVSDIRKCYIKHLPAAAGPPGQGGKIHTAVQCTPTCPAPPSPPAPGPPGPPPAPTGTLWKADVSAIPGITDITVLFVDGQRGIRARYPDANPETDKFPKGYVTSHTAWLPPKDYGPIKYINYSASRPEFVKLFQNFRGGVGGPCSVYDPPFSYWCAEETQGGGAAQFTLPGGLGYTMAQLPHTPYKNATGAVLWSWRPGHWANWAFEIGKDANSQFHFAKGGFQGGRGNKNGAEWYIENVFEECDVLNEFFYDPVAKELFYVAASASTPPVGVFEAPQLKTLFELKGSQASPVRNVTFQGLTITGSQYTYLDPHSAPSGGDWALQRMGALFFEGTTGATVEGCELLRLDGNGIMLSGFNQWTTIRHNHIAFTGDTAIAGWGFTSGSDPNQPKGTGPDGTKGDFPRWTLIDSNFIHHLGIHEKQSSCWFQAKTAETTLVNNICFEIPRAGYNINDGFGGGNHIESNLLFNTCGESGDHGAINTWDRQAYMTTIATGAPSYVPAETEINNNFIVSNGDADGGAIDNDDGSSHYNEHHNFCVYGGAKMANIDGHGKSYHNNINVYANVYGKNCNWQWPGWWPEKAQEEHYFNNTCILDQGQNYIKMLDGCSFKNVSSIRTVVHGNRVYSPGGDSAEVNGCGESIVVSEWLKLGADPDTTLHDSVDSAAIMAMGAELLGFQN